MSIGRRMRIKAVFVVAVFTLGMMACSFHAGVRTMPAYKCSIINLISTPELYDGKIVRVIGFYRKDFEHSAIYLSSIDAEHAISRNGVWVDYGSDEFGMSQYNNNYILLEGKFDIEMHGHLGAFPSAIKNIRRVAVWPPKENNPRELRAPAE